MVSYKFKDLTKSCSFSAICSQNSAYELAVLQTSIPKIDIVEVLLVRCEVGTSSCLLSNGDINPPLDTLRGSIAKIVSKT